MPITRPSNSSTLRVFQLHAPTRPPKQATLRRADLASCPPCRPQTSPSSANTPQRRTPPPSRPPSSSPTRPARSRSSTATPRRSSTSSSSRAPPPRSPSSTSRASARSSARTAHRHTRRCSACATRPPRCARRSAARCSAASGARGTCGRASTPCSPWSTCTCTSSRRTCARSGSRRRSTTTRSTRASGFSCTSTPCSSGSMRSHPTTTPCPRCARRSTSRCSRRGLHATTVKKPSRTCPRSRRTSRRSLTHSVRERASLRLQRSASARTRSLLKTSMEPTLLTVIAGMTAPRRRRSLPLARDLSRSTAEDMSHLASSSERVGRTIQLHFAAQDPTIVLTIYKPVQYPIVYVPHFG